jgi:predicted DNA-binding transcriptional regulator YafY
LPKKYLQRLNFNKLLNSFEGKLTTSKWAKICRCSQNTATRDIADLMGKGILIKLGEARATHYGYMPYKFQDIQLSFGPFDLGYQCFHFAECGG